MIIVFDEWMDFPCLNPCCNGIYLIITLYAMQVKKGQVLILVVMEYT